MLGAAMGIGGGIALSFYVSSLFLPHLSRAFGWSEAQFALVGIVALAATAGVILSGWAADRFGARRVALVGIIGMPLVWLGFSQLQGNIVHYYALFTLLMALGATTTSVVYSRVVVQRFFAARGLALAVAIAGAPAVGALAALPFDLWRTFEKGVIVKEEADLNYDGAVDFWEYYEGGVLDRVGIDRNGDGNVDEWQAKDAS